MAPESTLAQPAPSAPAKTEPVLVTLTDAAVAKIRGYLDEDKSLAGKSLRIFVQEGGCSGMEYGFGFDDRQDADLVVASSGFDVVVDPRSAEMLRGSSVDYVSGLEGEGFAVENPNATHSCGCGHSFSV